MTCLSLLVACTLSMGYGDIPEPAMGGFSTPMFLMGRPVWITPISRRQLLKNYAERTQKQSPATATDVATLV